MHDLQSLGHLVRCHQPSQSLYSRFRIPFLTSSSAGGRWAISLSRRFYHQPCFRRNLLRAWTFPTRPFYRQGHHRVDLSSAHSTIPLPLRIPLSCNSLASARSANNLSSFCLSPSLVGERSPRVSTDDTAGIMDGKTVLALSWAWVASDVAAAVACVPKACAPWVTVAAACELAA